MQRVSWLVFLEISSLLRKGSFFYLSCFHRVTWLLILFFPICLHLIFFSFVLIWGRSVRFSSSSKGKRCDRSPAASSIRLRECVHKREACRWGAGQIQGWGVEGWGERKEEKRRKMCYRRRKSQDEEEPRWGVGDGECGRLTMRKKSDDNDLHWLNVVNLK